METRMEEKDREVCLCFHVPLGKLAKFCRMERPRAASQLSECYGAGTGCGWCIPFLEQIFEQVQREETPAMKMSAEEYRRRRAEYHAAGRRHAPADAILPPRFDTAPPAAPPTPKSAEEAAPDG